MLEPARPAPPSSTHDPAREWITRHRVKYLAHLEDGPGFTGRLRRVARRLSVAQDRADADLFARHGGRPRGRA